MHQKLFLFSQPTFSALFLLMGWKNIFTVINIRKVSNLSSFIEYFNSFILTPTHMKQNVCPVCLKIFFNFNFNINFDFVISSYHKTIYCVEKIRPHEMVLSGFETLDPKDNILSSDVALLQTKNKTNNLYFPSLFLRPKISKKNNSKLYRMN